MTDLLQSKLLEFGESPERGGQSCEAVVGHIEDCQVSESASGGRELSQSVVLDVQLHKMPQITHTSLDEITV